MYKIILFIMMAVFYMMMHALQVDEELAMHTLFKAKHAVNRATHAAAQQMDMGKLAEGIYSIDPRMAETNALLYLQENLHLDPTNQPLPGSFLRSTVDVLDLQIVNEHETFPYLYSNPTYEYSVSLERPGVIMIIRVFYPRTYDVLGPIVWEIKGAAELVYDL